MSEVRRCPLCNCEIPPGSPEGICPKCLLKVGMESQSQHASHEESFKNPSADNPQLEPTIKPPPDSSNFVPPSPEELGIHFPQLEILELLGKGGMGAVYKARQPKLDRLIAVKILPAEIGQTPSFPERFQREARALAKLAHPNIVGIYDFGQTDSLYYFLMEFVDGINLRQAIQTGNVSAKDALAIVPQICEALQFAHDEGVVHRDIKPENILIDKKGRVKIADFGLAKLLGTDTSDVSLTATHQVMGTLRYMAPEQMQGSREVDHRADIYSLGVVFYELLTGDLPIGRFSLPSQKAKIDARLDEVVLRALEKEPRLRYQRANELKTSVESISSVGANAPHSVTRQRAGARLSITAVASPIWSLFLIPACVIACAYSMANGTVPGQVRFGKDFIHVLTYNSFATLLTWMTIVLGFSAPFGTTILGFVAIRQIRYSNGSQYGMRLAMCGALFYPLLILDFLLSLSLFEFGTRVFGAYLSNQPSLASDLLVGAIGLLIIFVDVVIFRALWRYSTEGQPQTPRMEFTPHSYIRRST